MAGPNEKVRRRYSEALKRDLVRQIDSGKLRVKDVCTIYGAAYQSVYRWLHQYSVHWKGGTRWIMEKKSASKQLKQLEARIKELEGMLGRKQVEIEYLEKLIELQSKELGIDLKKKGK